MDDENILAHAPIRSDDQILPFDAKTGAYNFQLDEARFVLDANLLRDALETTPIAQVHECVSALSGDATMDFVNELGYTKVIHFVSRMAVNNQYQPWRAILSMINQCLIGKISGPSLAKKAIMGKVTKVQNMKIAFQLVDEPDEKPAQPKPEPKYQDVEWAIQMSLESFQAQDQAHVGGVAIREPVAEATRPLLVKGKGKRQTPDTDETLIGPSAHPQDDTSVNIVRDSSSSVDAETGADTDKKNSRGTVGSDPGKTLKSLPPQEQEFIDEDQAGPDSRVSRVALARPNPKPTHEEFMDNVYPDVHRSLKFLADEHVILEEPVSSSETLSSMKNLYDAYTIGDRFLNDKPTKDKPALYEALEVFMRWENGDEFLAEKEKS
nr:hypothetical protein [Tanacetum cinerariifolium]